MDGLKLLQEARATGLEVRAEGDRLVVRGPRSQEAVAKRLLEWKATILAALKSQVPASQQPACFSCATTSGIREINKKTCWSRWVCRGCEGKVRVPSVHLCDPALPLSSPCQGKEPRSWVCPKCEAEVEVEAVEEVSGHPLTFWRCPKGCAVGVTPKGVRMPPVMVPRVEQ